MTEEQKPGSDLMEEFHALGQQLTTAVRALWESEDSRKLRTEIGDGFMELGQQLDSTIRAAQESEAAKQFSEQVKETVERARESDIAAKLEEGLVAGLQDLNQGLSKLVTSMEPSKPADQQPEAEAEPDAETGA
jgi:NAD dependent epimerase/dehydratase family enzyme